MDHSPIRQTFALGKFISIAGKSIINLVKLRSLAAKYRKMWKLLRAEKRYHISKPMSRAQTRRYAKRV